MTLSRPQRLAELTGEVGSEGRALSLMIPLGKAPEGWVWEEGVLHCQTCARVEREHQWRCPVCQALLCATGQGKPFRLCHDEAWLACPPEHPWDLVHVLVYATQDDNGRIATVWLQALTKVSGLQADKALLHQEVW